MARTMEMAEQVESNMGAGNPGSGDAPTFDEEIRPMTWLYELKTEAVALSTFPALLLSCRIQDDQDWLDRDAKFVVVLLGIQKLATGPRPVMRPVVQVLAKCRNMIHVPKTVLLGLDVGEPWSSLPEIVEGGYLELTPTGFMHVTRDYVWPTVQSVISWDEDRQRGMARLEHAIPFLDDLSTASFSDQASQDVLAQLETWFEDGFQVVGADPRRVVRRLKGTKALKPSEPPPARAQRDASPEHPQHVFFSCQEP